MGKVWDRIVLEEIYFAVAGIVLPIRNLTYFLVCTCTVHYTYNNTATLIILPIPLLLRHGPGFDPLSTTCLDLC